MSNIIVVVFTFKSIETILGEGGSAAWRLDRNNARRCEYAVCTRNGHADRVEGTEEHASAFLVGRIKDVVPRWKPGRYLIEFSHFARVNMPNVWRGDRNPVKYAASLESLGIDPATLHWEPMPEVAEAIQTVAEAPAPVGAVRGLTLTEAKTGLAITYGVRPEAIEIIIRG